MLRERSRDPNPLVDTVLENSTKTSGDEDAPSHSRTCDGAHTQDERVSEAPAGIDGKGDAVLSMSRFGPDRVLMADLGGSAIASGEFSGAGHGERA